MIDVGLFISYGLLGVCILTAIGMPLFRAFGDPSMLKRIGIGVGALLLVFFVSLGLAKGNEVANVSSSTSRMAGAGLITFYILFFLSIGGILFTEIKKALE